MTKRARKPRPRGGEKSEGVGTRALAAIPVQSPQITERHNTAQLGEGEAWLDELDMGILTSAMEHPSWTDKEIGEHFGVSREAINRRRNRPAFRAAIERTFRAGMEAASESLSLHAPAVVQKLLECALQNDPAKALQACKALLPYIVPRVQKARAASTSESEVRTTKVSVSEKRTRSITVRRSSR